MNKVLSLLSTNSVYRLPQRPHARAVLAAARAAASAAPAADRREAAAGVAGVLGGEAARLRVAEEARLGKVVQLRVVHDVPGWWIEIMIV